MNGQVACAEGAIAAGVNLFVGYPITPATEISERLSRRLPQVGAIYLQGADELDSLAIVIGSVWGGYKAMTATSGNGICLMQENIGYAAMTETPCVIVDMMRAGPGTGVATKTAQGDVFQVRYGSNADYSIIALAPESPQEMFDLTIEAFRLSEIYRVPTFVLGDEILAHTRETVVIPPQVHIQERYTTEQCPGPGYKTWAVPEGSRIPPMPAFGEGYCLAVSSFARTEDGSPTQNYSTYKPLIERLWNKVEEDQDALTQVETGWIDDIEILVIAFGPVARSVKSAVKQARAQGIRAGYCRLITLWPFPDRYLKRLGANLNKVLVAEMNMGKVVREVERCLSASTEVELLSKPGIELHRPSEILEAIKRMA